MPVPAELLPCECCHRLVEVSRDQLDAFERMHYVCFRYEYGHDSPIPTKNAQRATGSMIWTGRQSESAPTH